MKYDLHCHSYYSDGDLSPTALVSMAANIAITHLALTDHDTLDGLPEACEAAKNQGIELINGVELSCTWRGQLVHVVGLNIDPASDDLSIVINDNKQRRMQRAESMYSDFEKHGIDLREAVEQQLVGRGVPTRPHFADALIAKGYAKDKKQAFKRYLVRGKPGFVPMLWPELEEVGRAITASGGVAVLAHPMRYKLTRTKLCLLIKDMLQANIRGIEISTASTDQQQTIMLSELANKYDLVASMGSDFHSEQQPWAKLGHVAPLPDTVNPVWKAF